MSSQNTESQVTNAESQVSDFDSSWSKLEKQATDLQVGNSLPSISDSEFVSAAANFNTAYVNLTRSFSVLSHPSKVTQEPVIEKIPDKFDFITRHIDEINNDEKEFNSTEVQDTLNVVVNGVTDMMKNLSEYYETPSKVNLESFDLNVFLRNGIQLMMHARKLVLPSLLRFMEEVKLHPQEYYEDAQFLETKITNLLQELNSLAPGKSVATISFDGINYDLKFNI